MDTETKLWTLARRTAEAAQRSFAETGCAAHYLYFKPQGFDLAIAQDAPAGFELGDGQALRGSMTTDQLTRWVYDRARRYPILPVD